MRMPKSRTVDKHNTITRFAARARREGGHTFRIPSPPFDDMERTVIVSPRTSRARGRRHTLIMEDRDTEIGPLGETILEDYKQGRQRFWRMPRWFNRALRSQAEEERREMEEWQKRHNSLEI